MGLTVTVVPDRHINKETFAESLSTLKRNLGQSNSQKVDKLDSILPLDERIASRGLYGPENKVWEIARESSAFFGGGRAVFLQLAHPYVASGVEQHSTVANDIQVWIFTR